MTTAERIRAVIAFGFTERQARFLVLALRHGGICVPRQYAGLAGIAKAGRRCHALFGTLVSRGHASTIDCNHNRARLYHVHSKALYSAIGEPTSSYRRAVSPRTAITRLMILDAVLATPDVDWLTTDEAAAHFALRCSQARSAAASETVSGDSCEASRERRQLLPVGVDQSGRTVLLFLATEPWTSGLRRFLEGHLRLLRSTPDWRVRLAFPRPLNGLSSQYLAAVRDVLGPSVVNILERVDCVTLPHFYRHLSPGFVFGSDEGEYGASFKTAWESLQLVANGHNTKHAKHGSRADRATLQQIDLHWHDLRHEGACRLLADGVDIRIIQLMLGHASVQQTQRYLNVTDEELRKGLEVSWNRRTLKAVVGGANA